MRRALLWLPLAAFVAVLGVVLVALLRPAARDVRSAMVGQPLPRFSLKPLLPGTPGLDNATLTGRPHLLNVFASWCVPCAAEAPQLLQLKNRGVAIDAIAVRDTPDAVADFLARYGNPYERIGDDRGGRTQLALGSSGVPESFLIGADGKIIGQHIGDIRAEEVDTIARQLQVGR